MMEQMHCLVGFGFGGNASGSCLQSGAGLVQGVVTTQACCKFCAVPHTSPGSEAPARLDIIVKIIGVAQATVAARPRKRRLSIAPDSAKPSSVTSPPLSSSVR